MHHAARLHSQPPVGRLISKSYTFMTMGRLQKSNNDFTDVGVVRIVRVVGRVRRVRSVIRVGIVYTFVIKSVAYGLVPESYTFMTMGRLQKSNNDFTDVGVVRIVRIVVRVVRVRRDGIVCYLDDSSSFFIA